MMMKKVIIRLLIIILIRSVRVSLMVSRLSGEMEVTPKTPGIEEDQVEIGTGIEAGTEIEIGTEIGTEMG